MRFCALTRWWFTINLIHIHRTFNKYLLVHTQIYNSSKHQRDEIFPSAPDMMSSWSVSLMFICEGLVLVHRGVKLILRLIFSSSDGSISHCIIMILKEQILSINVWTPAIIIIIIIIRAWASFIWESNSCAGIYSHWVILLALYWKKWPQNKSHHLSAPKHQCKRAESQV